MKTPGRSYPVRLRTLTRIWVRTWVFALVLTLPACQTPISDYQPKTQDEKQIVRILMDFQNAKNDRDIKSLLPLLHPDGEFSYACGIMVTKAELTEKLPDFWAGLDKELLGTVPMAHECLNGDYYTSGVLKDPEITLSGDRAEVKVWFTRQWWSSLLLFVTLEKGDGRWQITRTWWGPS